MRARSAASQGNLIAVQMMVEVGGGWELKHCNPFPSITRVHANRLFSLQSCQKNDGGGGWGKTLASDLIVVDRGYKQCNSPFHIQANICQGIDLWLQRVGFTRGSPNARDLSLQAQQNAK